MEIRGANVLLTGATGGIGHAIARALAGRGAQLILTGRRQDVLEPLALELGARAVAVDLSLPAEVDRLVSVAGDPLDILVANAALPASGALNSFSTAQIDRALDVNLRAPIVLAREFTPGMVERRRGHVVLISSTAGKASAPGSSIYSASKFGLRGFAMGLRWELADSGVGVSTVFPGFIRDAGMFADADVSLPFGVGTRSPEDVASAVIRAIERNRGEIDVAPVTMRAGGVLSGIAPELAAALGRRLGAAEISAGIASSQADRR